MVVAFLSAPEALTFVRCKSDECPFITFYSLPETFHTVCVILTQFLCADRWACAYILHSHILHFAHFKHGCLCILRMLESLCVCMCLAKLGLFDQLFGGKARSHVTLCFSSCSWIRTTSPLCQETHRMGPNPFYPAFSAFLFQDYYCW